MEPYGFSPGVSQKELREFEKVGGADMELRRRLLKCLSHSKKVLKLEKYYFFENCLLLTEKRFLREKNDFLILFFIFASFETFFE
jgi:hypothetical protein